MTKFKIYTSTELTNEDYHGEQLKDHTSGSDIATVLERSVDHLFNSVHKDSPALAFGTAVHAAVLEPEVFEQEYIKDLDKADFEGALMSDAAIKSWLKERGISGYSQKKSPELIEMVRKTDQDVVIWSEIKAEFDDKAEGKTILSVTDSDKIEGMSSAFKAKYSSMIKVKNVEISLIGEIDGHKVKVRIDLIAEIDGEEWIIDYKSANNASPEKFGVDAHKLHYYEKMALQKECFKAAFGYEPAGIGLLAQEKEAPFACQLYRMDDDQLKLGWDNCLEAIEIIEEAVRTGDTKKGYGCDIEPLMTPRWLLSEIEDDILGELV